MVASAAHASALGVDVGGTAIKLGRVSADGQLSDTRSVPTPHDPDELAAVIAAEVERTPERAIGVVTPGITDEESGVVSFAANLGWRDVPIRSILQEKLSRPITIGHDVRAGALAEALWGAGSTREMLFLPLGTGIASAIVVDGALRGTGWSGEIGQVLVPDPDQLGARRPFEQIASAGAIATRYAVRTGNPDTSGGSAHVINLTLGQPADPVAVDVLQTAIDALADALAQAAGFLGPIPVVLGGGLAHAGDVLLTPLTAALAARLPVELMPPVRVAALGSWAGCLGAGALALNLGGHR